MGAEIVRSLERLLGVVIGGFTVYLGFRLFLALPEASDSSGRIKLPGGVNIFLSRIGPGAFFALFGCIVVATSFYQQVTVDRVRQLSPSHVDDADVARQVDSTRYVGVGSRATDVSLEQRAIRIKDARNTLASLNQTAYPLLSKLPASDRNSLRLALEESKLALLESVWDPQWGSFSAFRDWVRDGRQDSRPDNVRQEAVDLFQQGER